MTVGPQKALLWICACHFQLIFAARPSRDLSGILSTAETSEQGNHSQAERSNHGPLVAGPDGRNGCQNQRMYAGHILKQLGIQFDESGDHHSWPGIHWNDCWVIAIHLPEHQEVTGALSTPWNIFPELFYVDLSDTELSGDIGVFKDMPKLVKVMLDNTHVSGDIRAFKNGAHLERLYLTGTDVSGDIKVFESSSRLQELHLADTQVGGDIESLLADPDLPGCELSEVDLSNTHVSGNIRVVQAFPDLTELKLQNTFISGDISAFEATQKLIVLNLQSTGAYGDIKVFQRTRDLKILQLSLSRVFGDIQTFQDTPRLISLMLDATKVEGDIKVFEYLPHLKGATLSSTTVRGDIAVFNSTEHLTYLGLSDTEVFGDLQAFATTAHLQIMHLRKTKICGNVSALEGAAGLKELDLSATSIQGDIRVFENMKRLRVMVVSSTELTGDVSVFHQSFKLKKMDLSFTNVSGEIGVFKDRENLKRLRMASTGVWGNLQVLMKVGVVNAFETLDLSNTKVEGNIFVLKHAVGLKELHLGNTRVTGSIDGIVGWKSASVVDLSRTSVTGRLTEKWRGCCKHLRTLKLSGSRAEFLPIDSDLIKLTDLGEQDHDIMLPALTTLEVSECPLNGQLQDLVLPLAYCEHLGSIIAVNSGLKGDLPNLDPLGPTRVDGRLLIGERSKLASSLEFLELSGNNLRFFESIPPSIRKLVVSSNKSPLRVAERALPLALQRGVSIDLRGTTLHNDTRREAKRLLNDHVFNRTSDRTFSSRQNDGYTCYDLDRSSTTLQVLPDEFLPEELCACLPGWHGAGASCHECEEDTFKPDQGPAPCTPCPDNRTTKGNKGRTNVDECACEKRFKEHEGGEELKDKERLCKCKEGAAVFQEHCLECFPPKKRCRGGTLTLDHCGEGYKGPLCMQCKDEYFAVSGSCLKCKDTILPPKLVKAVTVVFIALLLGVLFLAVASLVYSLSPFRWLEEQVTGVIETIFGNDHLGEWRLQLAKRQAPILLQLCQLWSVLSALAGRGEEDSKSFWELKYMKHVQLVVGNVQEVLYLQCYFDAKQVRQNLAFAMPVVPLLLLLCCVFLEFRKNGDGTGVNAALKILTLFFVGGASKCSALTMCQKVDAGGWLLDQDMTFLRRLPDLPCKKDTVVSPDVAAVFWPCAVCYAILIPAFLFYIYVRQHLVLRYTRTPLELDPGNKTEALAVSHEDATLQRRLLAGLVAYVAVLQRGSVRVNIKNGHATVSFLDKDGTVVEFKAEEITKMTELFENESKKLQHYTITEMLLERFTLEQEGKNERCLKGAKETLMKYSTCRDSWMEVVLKLVTVAIVQAVAFSTGSSNLMIPLAKVSAATLSIAATVWMMQPYAEPQVNELQISCFLGLAMAAIGFCYRMVTLSRAALLLPLMLAAVQQTRPDSAEILAQRLWEKLPKDGQPRDESALTFMLPPSKAEPISFNLEYEKTVSSGSA